MASTSEIIDKYVDTVIKALDLEIDEERKSLQDSLDLKKKKNALMRLCEALKSLVVTTCNIAPYGLVFINFGCENTKSFKSHSFSPGDTVMVSAMSSVETLLGTGVPGCIEVVTDKEITVTFGGVQLFESAANNLFQMMKLPDDETFKRLKHAMRRLTKFPYETKIMTGLLFGSEKLEAISLPPALLDFNNQLILHNESLHPAQMEAIEFALKQKNLGIIHGPPGTGKTTTLVELIMQLIKSGEKVMVCAPSNVAVDNIMAKFQKYNLKCVRLGHPSRVSEENRPLTATAFLEASMPAQALKDAKTELQDMLKRLVLSEGSTKERAGFHTQIRKLRSEIRRRESKIASEALLGVDVCFATLGSSYRENILRYFPQNFFSTLVIDEASQSLEAGCWMAIPYAKRTILAGDHHQLSPMILSQEAAHLGLGTTLMERAIEKLGSDCFRLLTHQFRMNNKIMDWVSNEMYGGRLTSDISVANHLLTDLHGVEDTDETNTPLLLVDTSGCSHHEHCQHLSYGNLGEADLVAHMADLIFKAGVPQQSIAVITPYHRQVDLIKDSLASLSLRDVDVKTVDGFQGGESEAVILSLVRSNPQGELGFVTDRRRINVAVSRARRLLCVVADTSTVGKDETIASLIQHIRQQGQVRSAHAMRDDVIATCTTVQVENLKSGSTKQKKKKRTGVHDSDEPVNYKNFKEKLAQFVGSSESTLLISKVAGFQSLKIVAEIERLRLEYEVVREADKECIRVRKDVNYESASKDQEKQTAKVSKLALKTKEYNDFDETLLKFLDSSAIRLTFPSNLNAAQRAYIHEKAEKLGLAHASEGTKYNRHIFVYRPRKDATVDFECNSIEVDPVPHLDFYKITLQEFLLSDDASIEFEPIRSRSQQANIEREAEALGLRHEIVDFTTYTQLKVFKEEEDLKPEFNDDEFVEIVPLGPVSSEMAPTRQPKKKKVKKRTLQVEEPASDESDKLLDELVKRSGLCASAKCKTGVRLIGYDCPHCKQRYCIPHTQPEVHGCAAEAKKAARKEFTHPKPKSLSDDKKKALQKSLKSKLAAKTNLRTPAKK